MERARSQRLASEVPWPLPVRGLFKDANTSEINGSMAEVLDNWKSNGISLEMRDGYTRIESDSARQRIPFEFSNEPCYIEIYEAEAKCGLHRFSRAFPSSVSFTEISGYVLMADGAGEIIRYNGSAFSEARFTTDTGKPSSEFNGVFSHHDRVYAWDDSELAFYYGDIGAVTGELVRFPLDRLGNIKGKISFITSMTLNAAHGMNDILVIMTTTGMVVLYEGLDPGDANDWRLLGRVQAAPPISKFAIASFGADLWVLTKRGVASVRDTLSNGVLALTSSIASPISDMIVAAAKARPDAEGWQMMPRSDGEEVIINVPTETGFTQYAFAVESRSWFTSNYPAKWWHDLNGLTDFTDADGNLQRLTTQGSDNGEAITATFYTSWIRLPRHSEIAYLIPTIIAQGDLSVKVTVLTDHDDTPGDIAQAEQVIKMKPDNPGGKVALNEIIGINAAGRVFQARFEITGHSVSFENLLAGLV